MVIATYAQNPTSIKKFEYPEYLCPDPYMGKPMRSGSTLLISYSSKSASYGIEFKFGFMKYSLNVSYKGKSIGGQYVYSGYEINNMVQTTVRTSTKLSQFLNNYGQVQEDSFEKNKQLDIHINGMGSLSVYPIKDTPQKRKKIEEEKRREEEQKIAEDRAKSTLEKLLPIGQKSLEDSVRQEAIKEFFKNGGKKNYGKSYIASIDTKRSYIAAIDTMSQVTIIKKNDDIYNEMLHKEWLEKKPEYKDYYKGAKVINEKVYFEESFDLNEYIKIQENECSVRYDKKTNSYIYYKEPYRSNLFDESNQMEAPKEITEIIENNIKKKGMYSLFWETLDGKLVSLSYIKNGFMEKDYTTELYSIYK